MATYDSNSAVFYVFISIKRQNSTTIQNNKSIKHHWNINIFVFPNFLKIFQFYRNARSPRVPLGSPGWCTILSTNRPSVQSVQSIPSIQSVKSVVSVRPNRPSNPSSAGPPKMSNVRSFPNTYLKKQLSQKSKSRTGFGPKMSAISSSGAVDRMGESSQPCR